MISNYETYNSKSEHWLKESQLVLTVLGVSSGPIDGRTAIQKIVYFASVKLNYDLKYKPHFYGPYSSAVAEILEDLVMSDLITEKARTTMHDRSMYSYSLTDDGLKVLEGLKESQSEAYGVVGEVVRKCRDFTNNSISVLSWAAKVYFMVSQKEGAGLSYDEAISTGKRFGWRLSKKEIGSGVKLLSGLGLARKSAA